jgi:hypothetical protein
MKITQAKINSRLDIAEENDGTGKRNIRNYSKLNTQSNK